MTDGASSWNSEGRVCIPCRSLQDEPELPDLASMGIQSPVIRQGVEFWQMVCAGRPFPMRKDFDPTDLPRHLLPHILLIDVIDSERPDFRWRLIGTHTTEIMQRDSTGKVWSELYSPADLENVTEGPRAVLRTGMPCRTMARAPQFERRFVTIESVDLPLSTNGRQIDMIMAFNHAA